MDTSETYIEMCEKAEEIQGRELVDGDWYATVFRDGVFLVYPHDAWDIPYYRHHRVECVWLPRQDQLQEMVDLPSPLHMLEHLNSWIMTEVRGTNPALLTSMEQLWLAFVMKEKYGKVWGDGEWVPV